MVSIARRNLLHDRLRLVTAVMGVVVSVVLVTCLCGLYVASSAHASGLVDHAGADLWLVAPGTACVDRGQLISMRRLYQAMATPGVLWAEPLLVKFAEWKLPDGRREVTQLVGTVRDTRLDIPWGESTATQNALRLPNAVVIDDRERMRFGTKGQALGAGEGAEILGQRATVAAFTRGIGSFTAVPYVFTDHGRAQEFVGVPEQSTTYILLKLDAGASVELVQALLRQDMPDVDVLTSQEFAAMTRNYWLFRTGLGTSLVFAAVLGLIVGSVMVSQTMYASTMSRLHEYATLKAMGMGNRALGRIVLEQAVLLGALSYLAGMTISTLIAKGTAGGNLSIALPPWLYVAMLAVTLTICVVASLTSVGKVLRLSPASILGNS